MVHIHHHCMAESCYGGDLVHQAMVKVMEIALGAGISIQFGPQAISAGASSPAKY
jgi:hypothetical protein